MNVGRFAAAVLGVWVVRTIMNFLFYGVAMAEQYGAIMAQHPGVFREVIPGFIATDLVFAAFLVFIWTKAAGGFAAGPLGGAVYGAWMGAFFGISANLYYFFGFTIFSVGDIVLDSVYTIVTVAVQGAVAATIYTKASPARARI